MTDPREVRRAVVFKGGVAAATLTRRDGGVRFEYLDQYAGPPVAHTLPPDRPQDTVAGAVPAFFANLLPEGRRLNALLRMVKTSADDEFSLLLAVGSDVVGDVAVVADGVDPVEVSPTVADLRDLADLRFSDLLAERGFVDRQGLAGVQDKLSAGMITFPARVGSGPAIVKLDPPDYPHAVVNEHYFLGLARALKLPVSAARLVHDSDGRHGLVVKRFDRKIGADGAMIRLAVEDALQLLGRYPAEKYLVTSEQLAEAVRQPCAASAVAARAVLQQIAFAWLTGNGDLHAKNVSVLQQPDGEWRVAPVYDVPSTLPYGDSSMALRLQGTRQNLSRKRFLAFGAELGLGLAAVERALNEVLSVTEPMLDDLADGVLPWTVSQRREVVRQLRVRRAALEGAA
ncbi:MAG TPA: type II toxin-antitoxin system HipA family toxin [Propionibacteriaceae bacterium]|nr:type II toxin-antitoxin system HipA family toxin [Propionibacteriaceae bacterium]